MFIGWLICQKVKGVFKACYSSFSRNRNTHTFILWFKEKDAYCCKLKLVYKK
jgi:hypothetical protein